MSPWGVVQLNILFSFFNDKRIYEKSFFFLRKKLVCWMEMNGVVAPTTWIWMNTINLSF
jgi:hypothetical protein